MNAFTILIVILVLLIYALICFYIGYNGWVWLKTTRLSNFKKTYFSLVIILALSIFAGRIFPYPVLEVAGNIWMVILAFGLIILPISNLVYFFIKKKGVFWIGIGVISFYLVLVAYGSYNAWSPVVRAYDIQIDKKSEYQELKILMASDFHLSTTVGRNHLERFVKIVAAEQPDMILLPGDIINDNIEPYLKNNMGELLGEIEAPLGVYAVLGNHDYYGDDTNTLLEEMEKVGVTVLMDEFVSVDEQFYVVGRKEHTDRTRRKINEYMVGLDKNKPIIMMDHQPKDLEEAKENGVDLLLSGHTHGGQIFPGNLVTNKIFENDYGYLKKDNLHSIVSSGFGLWGPPLRIGTRSEVMVLHVKFVQ